MQDYSSNLDSITSGIEQHIADIENSKGNTEHNLINLFDELAFMHHSNGRLDSAERFYLRSLTSRETLYGASSDGCLPVLHRLGVLFRVQGKYEYAELFYNRTLLLTRELSGSSSLDLATRSNYLAGLYLAWSKYEKAKRFIDISIDLYRTHLGEDHLYVGFCLIALAIVQFREGENEKAEICLDIADSIVQPLVLLELAPSRASLPALVASLALIYCRQLKFGEAEIMFRYALMQEAREIWPAHPSVGAELEKLAMLYRSKGRIRAADFLQAECLKLTTNNSDLEHPDFQKTVSLMTDMNEELIVTQFRKENLFQSLLAEVERIN